MTKLNRNAAAGLALGGLLALAASALAQPMPDPFEFRLASLAAATHPRAGLRLTAPTRRPLLDARSGDTALGVLLPGVEVTVLATAGKRVRVRFDGWQQDEGARAVYARRGLRILSLILTPQAAATLKPGPGTTDPATGAVWRAVRVTGWLDAAGLVAAGPGFNRAVDELNTAYCGSCHTLRQPAAEEVNRWAGTMTGSRHRMLLPDDQRELLLHWLQMGAADSKGF
jgi:hypothetical protein